MWKLFRRFLRLEGKRALKILPRYYLGTFAMVALFVVIAFCGTAGDDRETGMGKIRLALVMNDRYLQNFGMDVLNSAQSVSSLCDFASVTEEEATEGLQSGKYDAAMVFPKQFVDSIYSDGYAGKAKLYSPDIQDTMNRGMLESLVSVGCDLLAVYESYVNAALIVAEENGADETDSGRVWDDTELLLGSYILNREDGFVTADASGTDGQTALQYYFCAGIVILLMLGGVACGTLLKSDCPALCSQLEVYGIRETKLALARYLAVTFLFWIFYTTIFAVLWALWLGKPELMERTFAVTRFSELWYWYVTGLPILLLASALVLLVYTFAANQIGGILLLFLITALMGYSSGCIVPAAYLPKAVRAVGNYMPTYTMLHVCTGGLRQNAEWTREIILLAETAVAFGLTVGIMKWNRWREQNG